MKRHGGMISAFGETDKGNYVAFKKYIEKPNKIYITVS